MTSLNAIRWEDTRDRYQSTYLPFISKYIKFRTPPGHEGMISKQTGKPFKRKGKKGRKRGNNEVFWGKKRKKMILPLRFCFFQIGHGLQNRWNMNIYTPEKLYSGSYTGSYSGSCSPPLCYLLLPVLRCGTPAPAPTVSPKHHWSTTFHLQTRIGIYVVKY